MRISSDPGALMRHSRAAFEASVDDVVTDARARAARHSRTGRFERSITRTEVIELGSRLVARVGSPLSSAHAKEVGAFIVARRGPALRFKVEGQWVTVPAPDGIRIPARPAIVPAGRQFPRTFTGRLRGTPLRGSYDRSRARRVDMRAGRVRVR